jgi:hypothetical protein
MRISKSSICLALGVAGLSFHAHGGTFSKTQYTTPVAANLISAATNDLNDLTYTETATEGTITYTLPEDLTAGLKRRIQLKGPPIDAGAKLTILNDGVAVAACSQSLQRIMCLVQYDRNALFKLAPGEVRQTPKEFLSKKYVPGKFQDAKIAVGAAFGTEPAGVLIGWF